jgi:hypothetical protein
LFAGADHDTSARALPRTAATPEGASGTVAGVVDTLGDEAGESPTSFVAITANVYGVPFVSPVTAHDNEFAAKVVQDPLPGLAVTR